MNKKEQAFVETVWEHYREHGRHGLPWRKTSDPYKIIVSELMLQQTQVGRVEPKYESFVKRWPNAKRLASASLGDVLRAWQGLGYNRRAKYLHQLARYIVLLTKQVWPTTVADLQKLPGIGPYTAAAVAAFAYNQPVVLIETNVRQVFLHHFFQNKDTVTDAEMLKLVEKTLPKDNPREWYWALMDYGSFLKQQHGNLGSKSNHYSKQSKFTGSDREVRGAILRSLVGGAKTSQQLKKDLAPLSPTKVTKQLTALIAEGLISKEKGKLYRLP